MQSAIIAAIITAIAVLVGLTFIGYQLVQLARSQRRRLEIERSLAQHRRAEQWGKRYDDASGVRRSDPPPPKREAA